MTSRPGVAVLAVGIDAAEPTLIRELIDAGRLPAMSRLLREGSWRAVRSAAGVGSGSVWPSFMTGEDPLDHGIHADWSWQPETMTAGRCRADRLVPFWKALAEAGVRVGVIDVPYAPSAGLREGFEIAEWGPHDVLDGHVRAEPPGVAAVVRRHRPHPFTSGLLNPASSADIPAQHAILEACLEGVRARGELVRQLIGERQPQCLIVDFSEVHHASHFLWHTLRRGRPMAAGAGETANLAAVYEAVDREVATLIDAAGSDAAVLVFSLHGMRPATGVATFLAPLLCEHGFARLTDWTRQSPRERGLSVFATVKRHTPQALKALYYRAVPQAATRRFARPTFLPVYDWSATRAFAWPSDQHGWIRINLKGRESAGTVEPEDYEPTCAALDALLRSLTDDASRPLVANVIRPASRIEEAVDSLLPDLVVHWTDAALASPLRVRGSRLTAHAVAPYLTGQHSLDGFCIARGIATDLPDDGPIRATDLHRVIAQACLAPGRSGEPAVLRARRGYFGGTNLIQPVH